MTTRQQVLTSRSPTDGHVVATFQVMGPDRVAEAVDAARIAAHWWADLGYPERRRRLLRFKSVLVGRARELAELVHEENGKPIEDALLEIILSVEHVHWAALNAAKVLRRRSVMPTPLTINHAAAVEYQPLGVVGVIGPWNYPVFTPLGSIVYALAAGNAVVFKPSEYSPAIGRWLVEAINEATPEQPIALLVTGFGETGAALCRSGVDKISFTGSTPTGRRVMAQCADTLTPVLLECGGKDAVLVDADADIGKAVEAAAFGAFSNAGQTCAGVERVYVHEAVYEQFVDLMAERTRSLTPGTTRDASYGPMTMPAQVEVVRAHVQDALDRGATAVVGGLGAVGDDAAADRPDRPGANVIGPTLLTDVPEDSLAIIEETFGPTVVVNRVRDLDEAVDRANASDFGLGASVFSGDKARLERAAARLQCGMVSMNSWLMYAAVADLPWGGVKASGFGRIHGADGLREFARAKSTIRERFSVPITLTSFARHPKTTDILLRVTELLHRR
jgi:acyl-CoA reductase-like NAD-dependent aldehyde dehydrogenase